MKNGCVNFNILNATIITGRGTDKVSVEIDVPSSLFIGNGTSNGNTIFHCEQKAGTGTQWCVNNLGVDPEVIDLLRY